MKNEFHDRRNRRSGFKGRSLITLVLVFSMIISVPFFSNAEEGESAAGNTAAGNTASGKFNSQESCSLTVKVNDPFVELTDLFDADLAIDLYQLAPVKANVGSDGYTFDWKNSSYRSLENDYESLNDTSSAEPEDASDDSETESEDAPDDSEFVTDLTGNAMHILSQKAAGLVLDPGTGTVKDGISKSNTGNGQIGEEGITITDISAGLYLLVVRNNNATDDYVTTRMEEDGTTENIVTMASSDINSYTFLPQLVSLPKRGDEIGVPTNTADREAWNYDVTVYLKPEKGNGSLVIEKTLESYYDNLKLTTFVFHVKAESQNGSIVYYDNYVSIDFDGPGTKNVEINDIPVGAKVTVEEVYDGSSYRLLGDRIIEETINGNIEPVVFTFVNEYDGTQTGGHGINNHFEYTDGGWKHVPTEASSQDE